MKSVGPRNAGTGTSHRFEVRTTRNRNIRPRPPFFRHTVFGEVPMAKLKFLGAAALVAAALAAPAMAQQAMQEPGIYAQSRPSANDYRYGRPGFWPGEVAAGVVARAVGTADTMVMVPLRGTDAYAYYGGPSSDDTYAYFGDRPVRRRTPRRLPSGRHHIGP